MQAQFGFYRPGDNTSGAYSSSGNGFGGTTADPIQHFAIGAFTGDNGLPPDGTLFNSEADYSDYALKLTDKHDQISSEGLSFTLTNVVGSWIVIGGFGDDKVNANGQAGPAVTGDGMLSGGLGDNSLIAGSGNDLISGGDGNDTLNGGAGDDTISAGTGADKIVGGAGHNTYDMSDLSMAVTFDTSVSGPQTIDGETKDVSGFANLIGTSEGDLFTGNGADNHFQGGDGNDTLDSGYGADTLEGQGGDDLVIAGLGDQTLSGGSGNDTLSYEKVYTQGITVDLAYQDGVQSQLVGFGAQVLSGFENLIGTGKDDTLTGDSGANTILGGDGADTINGRGGDDVLAGGGGVNTVSYLFSLTGVTVDLNQQGAGQTTNVGSQTLTGFTNLEGSHQANQLTGDAADNTILSGGGADTLDGGDTVSFSDANGGVLIDLSGGYFLDSHANTGSLANFQDVVGSGYDDNIADDDGDNAVSGLGGDDIFYVRGGADTLDGGTGSDTVSFAFAQSGVTVDLGQQGYSQTTNLGDKTLVNIENLTGGNYGDHLVGDANSNKLVGGDGDDYLVSYDGQDSITGDNGNDTILAGAGDQTLAGGGDVDLLSYANANTYVNVSLALQGQAQNTNVGQQVLSGFENLKGSTADDSLYGDDNANQIDGNGGDNYINAAGGADTIFATVGNDIIDGGDGVDTLSFEHSQVGVSLNLSVATAQSTGGGSYRVSNVENLVGSASADTLTGDAGANLLDGRGGDDILSGGDGADTLLASGSGDHLDGGDGVDLASYAGASAGVNVDLSNAALVKSIELVEGSTYGDTLISGAGQTINGGAGDDVVDLSLGDSADGGADFDTLSFATSSAGVTVDLGAQTAQQAGRGVQTFQNFEGVVGSGGADSLIGTSAAEGLDGGDGNDTIVAGGGQDTLIGGAGHNTVSFEGVAGGVSLDLSSPYGYTLTDYVSISGFSDVIGTADNDRITGDVDANSLVGGMGDDTLGGGVGDTLVGGDGNDTAILSGRQAVHIDLSVTGDQTIGAGTIQITGVENLVGSSRGDYLAGNSDANALTGGAGADTLVATAGADTLDGGIGRDTADFSQLTAGVHIDVPGSAADAGGQTYVLQSVEAFVGTSLADSYADGVGDQSFAGGGGDDTVRAGSGADTFNGGVGSDTISFGDATQGVTISLADRRAQVTADGSVTLRGFENLNGSVQADHLTGSAGANVIVGNGGGDTIDGGGGDDTLIGSNSGDTVSYAGATRGVQVVLYNQGVAQQTGVGDQLLLGFSNLEGSSHNDVLVGDFNDNVISGGGGQDVIFATPGADTYDGGAGRDVVVYQGSGPVIVDFAHGVVQVAGYTQTLISIEGVVGPDFASLYIDDDSFRGIQGGSGRDTVVAGLGNDIYSGGGGIDLVDFSAGSGVSVDLARTTSQDTGMGSKILIGFEQVTGSAGNDTLLGSSAANVIKGGGGDDIINGRGGADTLKGGDGGKSTVSYAGSANGVHVSLDLQGSAQDTGVGLQVLDNFNTLVGSSYDDTLGGAGRSERLDGGRGDDHLSGLGGADTLVGGAGKDVLDGGTAADTLVSLGDGDQLTGGTGADTFRFDDLQAKNAATIVDLAASETIDLRGAETATGLAFTEVNQFHHTAGEFLLSYDQASNSTTVRFDLDGDGKADHLIALQGGDFSAYDHFQL